MSIKEQIRAEIERQIDTCYRADGRIAPPRTRNAIVADEFRNLLSFLDTLPEQSVEGLEEAAGAYLDNHKPLTRYNWGDLMDAFKAGAEWMKSKMMEEAVEANLLSIEGDSYGIVSYTFQGRRFPAAFSGKCFSYKIIVMKDEK